MRHLRVKNSTFKTTCIINVHNGEEFISCAIKSVLEQNEPVALLVVNNASTDQTKKIIQGYVDLYQNVEYKETPRFMLLGEARNYSLNFVNSEYVVWLDADDLWYKDFSFMGESLLNKYGDLGYITSNVEVVNKYKKTLDIDVNPVGLKVFLEEKPGGITCPIYIGDSLEDLITRTHLTAGWSSYFFRKADVVKAGGFNPNLTYAEDYDLVVKITCNSGGMHIGKVLSSARMHEERVTTRINPVSIYDEINYITYKYGNLKLGRYAILRALLSVKLIYWALFKSTYKPVLVNVMIGLGGIGVAALIFFGLLPRKCLINCDKYNNY